MDLNPHVNKLAVYGTLREFRGNEGYVEGYTLVRPKGCPFPAIIRGDGKIVVEVLDMTDEEIDVIDRYEGVAHGLYKRTLAPVHINGDIITAFIYEGKDIGEYDILKTGDWKNECTVKSNG